jgi:hypothetical protein
MRPVPTFYAPGSGRGLASNLRFRRRPAARFLNRDENKENEARAESSQHLEIEARFEERSKNLQIGTYLRIDPAP